MRCICKKSLMKREGELVYIVVKDKDGKDKLEAGNLSYNLGKDEFTIEGSNYAEVEEHKVTQMPDTWYREENFCYKLSDRQEIFFREEESMHESPLVKYKLNLRK